MRKVVIYKIKSLRDGKVYIGSTVNLKNRWKCHRTGLRKGNHHSRHLQNAWNLYGENNFVVEEIAHSCEIFKADIEQHWIDTFDACNPSKGYNHAPQAIGGCTRKHSEATKEKIRQGNLGKTRSAEHRRRLSEVQKGRIISEETRLKLSAALKGRVHTPESYKKASETRRKNGFTLSEESRQKLREKAIGRKASEETRKKLSVASTGRKWSASQREKMLAVERKPLTVEQRVNIAKGRGFLPFIVECPDGAKLVFNSLRQAADALNLDASNIQKCLIGKANQTKGYRCYRDPHTAYKS